MKTLLVVIPETMKKHVGEEYDEFITVKGMPLMEELDQEAKRIWGIMKRLAAEDKAAVEGAEGEYECKLVVHSDVSAPYNVAIASLAGIVEKEEGMPVEIPDVPEGGPMVESLEEFQKAGGKITGNG